MDIRKRIHHGAVILLGLISITFSTIGGVQYNKLRDSKARLIKVERERDITIENLTNSYLLVLAEKEDELKKLNLTLKTTFKDNRILKTLMNKDMVDWTEDEVLMTKDKLSSIPSGSWFEGGYYVTAPFGATNLIGSFWGTHGHRGVDIKPESGNDHEPILSTIDGRVITWGRNDRLFGNYLVIESLDGMYQIKLAHLSSIAIFQEDGSVDLGEGMEFKKGTRIATMGGTGHVTGPHLHVEMYIMDNSQWRLLNASVVIDYIGE